MFGPEDFYFIKTIRADENDFFREFVFQCTRTKEQQRKFPLRWGAKGIFTVDGTGVHKRSEKKPQYTPEEKLLFSKANSVSLVLPTVPTPIFGHDKERHQKLVGMMFAESNVLYTKRFFIYDGGTCGRPYDYSNEYEADAYFKKKVESPNPVLFHEIEAFKKALKNAANEDKINETLSRVRWTNDGNTRLFIASNNLDSRLLAQDRARILRQRLIAQSEELGLSWDDSYQVPICFFAPGDASHLTLYNEEEQAADRQKAKEIFQNETLRKEEEIKGNYEFLLFIDHLREHYSDEEWIALVERLIKDKQPAIAWSLLEIIPSLYEDPCSKRLILFALVQAAVGHASTEVKLILNKKPEIIDSADDYNAVMRNMIPEDRIAVYEGMKHKLPDIITSASDLGMVLPFTNPQDCQKICEAIKAKIPGFVRVANDLSSILQNLSLEQTVIVCDSIKDKWNSTTIKSLHNLGEVLSAITPEQIKVIKDRWIGLLTSPQDIHYIMPYLNPYQKASIFEAVLDRLPNILISIENLRDIWYLMSSAYQLALCGALKDKWSDLIKSPKDLALLLNMLELEQRPMVYEALKDKWSTIFSSAQDFCLIQGDAFREIFTLMKDKWPDIFKSRNDFCSIYRTYSLSADQKREMFNLISFMDEIKGNAVPLASVLMGCDKVQIKIQCDTLFQQAIDEDSKHFGWLGYSSIYLKLMKNLSQLAPCWLNKLNTALDLKLSDEQLASPELIEQAFWNYKGYKDEASDTTSPLMSK